MNLLRPKKYQHLNKVLISQSSLRFNFNSLQSFHPEAKIAPVLKSNAYGHGLQTMAPLFDSFNPPFLIVDSLYEAYELQKLNLKTPILILGYTHPDNLKVKRLPFHFAVFDLNTAKALNQKQPHCPVHLFIDTGMHREGILLSGLPNFLHELNKLKNVDVVGLASHFADADNPSSGTFTRYQIAQFKKALDIVKSYGYKPKWRHISASGGAFKVKDTSLNMIRVGLAIYGINPLETSDAQYRQIKLKPSLSFVSTLAQIKTINRGKSIGYSRTFIAKKKMTIGLLPAGYYDGVDRRLSNLGLVTVRGIPCPILGKVSMNITVIGLDKVPEAVVGDKAIIYSSHTGDQNTIAQVAQSIRTIPYEILVHLAETLKREVID